MPRQKTAGKRPALMFYYGDYKRDPALRMCSPATRGIWVDLFLAMADAERGALVGTVAELAQIGSCTPDQMRAALVDLHSKNAAIVAPGEQRGRDLLAQWTANGHANGRLLDTDLTGVCTVVSRRIQREEDARNFARERQNRRRQRRDAVPVTPESRESHAPSSSSSAVSSVLPSEEPPVGPPRGDDAHAGEQESLFDVPQKPREQPAAARKKAKSEIAAAVRADAERVLAALNEARKRVRPTSGVIRPTGKSLEHIARQLAAGHTVEDCLRVIAARENECRRGQRTRDGKDVFEYFNQVTPFRDAPFQYSLANAPPLATVTPLPVRRDPDRRAIDPAIAKMIARDSGGGGETGSGGGGAQCA